MKRNDLVEAKRLDQKALLEKVRILRGEITDLILDKHMNKLKDLKIISKKRRDVAQILTIARQKQLMEELEGKVKGAEPKNEKTAALDEKTKRKEGNRQKVVMDNLADNAN